MPFYSVVIPVLNNAKYLDEAITSVINQKFNDWEILIVDDGSSDGSYEIACDWARKDKRIRVYCHEGRSNKGVSASRNLAIRHSLGVWTVFLDADDKWSDDKLLKQHEAIKGESENLVFVYNKAIVINENSELTNVKTYGAGKNGLLINPFLKIINKNFEAPTSSVAIRSKILKGLWFREHLSYVEDALLWWEIIEHGDVFYIDEPLTFYRTHSTQWNARTSEEVKAGRRFLVYKELLRSHEDNSYVKYLLISKGYRIKISYYLLHHFQIGKIYSVTREVIGISNLNLAYKLLAVLIFFWEVILLPLKWMYFKLKG